VLCRPPTHPPNYQGLYLSVFLAGEIEVLVLDAEVANVGSNGAIVGFAVVELLDQLAKLEVENKHFTL